MVRHVIMIVLWAIENNLVYFWMVCNSFLGYGEKLSLFEDYSGL